MNSSEICINLKRKKSAKELVNTYIQNLRKMCKVHWARCLQFTQPLKLKTVEGEYGELKAGVKGRGICLVFPSRLAACLPQSPVCSLFLIATCTCLSLLVSTAFSLLQHKVFNMFNTVLHVEHLLFYSILEHPVLPVELIAWSATVFYRLNIVSRMSSSTVHGKFLFLQ